MCEVLDFRLHWSILNSNSRLVLNFSIMQLWQSIIPHLFIILFQDITNIWLPRDDHIPNPNSYGKHALIFRIIIHDHTHHKYYSSYLLPMCPNNNVLPTVSFSTLRIRNFIVLMVRKHYNNIIIHINEITIQELIIKNTKSRIKTKNQPVSSSIQYKRFSLAYSCRNYKENKRKTSPES